jgi:hypothetical protein
VTARRRLTPVNITERAPSFRTGRRETWAAESRDGLWFYKREEDTGTPWIAEHVPTGALSWYGTLTAARHATAMGWANTGCPDCEASGGHNDKCPALT